MMLEAVIHLLKIWGTMGVNSNNNPHSPHLVGVMLNTPIDHPHLQAQVIEVVLPHHNIVNQVCDPAHANKHGALKLEINAKKS